MEAEEGINRGDVRRHFESENVLLDASQQQFHDDLSRQHGGQFQGQTATGPRFVRTVGSGTDRDPISSFVVQRRREHPFRAILDRDDADSTVATAEDFTLVLNKGFYHSPKKLVNRLENLRSSVKKLHDRLKFKFDEVSQKVTLFLKPRTSARLSPPLARLLGFDMTDIPYGRNKRSRVSDLDQGFSSLYVYCNVVQPTVVGDTFVPLLRIVPVEGKTGHTVHSHLPEHSIPASSSE